MKRFYHVDFVRAVAILVIIIVHVLSDNITSSLQNVLWNVLHFGIIAFIFCSGYVLYAGYGHRLNSVVAMLQWYKKRLLRLVIPFYWYLGAHYLLMLVFPAFFTGLGLVVSWKFVIQSITLIGGINLNWLPLLFLELGILFPLLVFLFHRKRIAFWMYVAFASLFTLMSTFASIPYSDYRQLMWIPWSLFLVLPWYFVQKEQKQFYALPYAIVTAISGAIFLVLFFVWSHSGRSLTLIDNKYPPNLYYLSYDGIGTFLLFAISGWKIWQKKVVQNLYTWISKVSYSLFFIHFIVLDFVLSLQKQLHMHISLTFQVVGVVGVSLLVAWSLKLLFSVLLNKR